MIAWTRLLPTLAALTLSGAGLGVYLGHAAVGEIDPFYFSTPLGTETYAALVPAASRTGPPAHVSEPHHSDRGYGTGCSGCGLREASYPSEADGVADGYAASAWTPAEEPSVQRTVYEVEAEPTIGPDPALYEDLKRVERYAYYPVRAQLGDAHHAATAAVIEREPEATVAETPPATGEEPYYGY